MLTHATSLTDGRLDDEGALDEEGVLDEEGDLDRPRGAMLVLSLSIWPI